jgi:cellulose synthase/poly-beta-1,6-N-acetylglucosamine synthase-like glycosyltransferase
MAMETNILVYCLLAITAGYALLLLYVTYSWLTLYEVALPYTLTPVKVSVLVPARNEEHTLAALLRDLSQQQYPVHNLEIIVIDDSSTDSTLAVAHEQADLATVPIKVISLKGTGLYSKKQALAKGVAIASGELILTTDADCRVQEGWVNAFVSAYQSSGADLLCGPVVLEGDDSLFANMQSIEFASLIGTGGVCISKGWPAMGNGANLAFSKKAYVKAGGYEGTYHIASGDDEHLMQKVYADGGKIAFVKSRAAVVQTEVKPNWQAFAEQRKRWAGKWKYNTNVNTILLALAVFCFHLGFIVLALATLGGYIPAGVFSLILLTKALAEGLLLWTVLKSTGGKFSIKAFLLLQLVHSIYVVYIGLLVNISKSYIWKDRQFV